MGLKIILSEEDKQRIKDKRLDILLNYGSLTPEKDIYCPKIFWDGLGHNSEMGDWCCILREEYSEEYNQNKDYLPCNCLDYNSCKTLKSFIKNN